MGVEVIEVVMGEEQHLRLIKANSSRMASSSALASPLTDPILFLDKSS
jgi:hypothetical protein